MPLAIISLPKFQDEVEDVIPALWRGGVSEFFATLIFVFVGTGAVVASQAVLGQTQNLQVPNLTLIALAHGFAIMVLVYAVGEISGGHINPAVTWACLLTNKISFIRALVYVIAQLSGAVVGSALLKAIIPPILQGGMGCHSINPLLSVGQGFGAETIFTFIFIFVVFATAISPFAGKLAPLSSGGSQEYGPGKLTPFAVGMTILILHCVGIPFTGASMNPARTFGPALVVGCWANHWVYWCGPLLGSTIAALLAQIIFLSNPTTMLAIFKSQHGQSEETTTTTADQPTQDTPSTYSVMKEEDVQLEEH